MPDIFNSSPLSSFAISSQQTPSVLGSNQAVQNYINTDFNNMMANSNLSLQKIVPELNKTLNNSKPSINTNLWSTVGQIFDVAGSFMPQKTEYNGAKGDITQTMDSVYDGLADTAMSLGPYGMLVGGIMKGRALLGKGMNALGGGTSGMTTTDAILGSSFLNMTPLGLINGFGGKRVNTITKDNEAFAQIGGSYAGSNYLVDRALQKSGKKYGLFSSGARNKANKEINEARRQQDLITDIADNALDRSTLLATMSAIRGNQRQFNMQGGYDQASVRVGKNGMLLEKARNILKSQKDSKFVKPSYEVWIKDVNPEYQSDWYDLETAYQYLPYEQLQRWKFAVNSKDPKYYMNYKDKKGVYIYHLPSILPIEETGDYMFLKKGTEIDNPEVHFETDTYYNNKNGLKNTHNLIFEGDRYYYRKKKSSVKKETPQHKNGGSIIELVTKTTIDMINPLDVPEFQNGGSINVIPEGALHARKHNIDINGITKKGIPVISETEDGKIEQQAEVEREEVILRLEVTQKLEELEKKYYDGKTSQKEKDEYALEAGKLLTKELLHNTKDNVGLL